MRGLLIALLLLAIAGEVLILVGLNIVDKDIHKPAPVQGVELKETPAKKDIEL